MGNKCLEKVIEDEQSETYHKGDVINIEKIPCSDEVMLGQSLCTASHGLEVEGEVDKLLGSKKSQPTRGLEVFKKPGRRGWLREVVLSRVIENLVVQVNYLSPGDESRKKLSSYKEIETYLAETGDSSLTRENFSLSRKFFGLGDSFEFTRMSQKVKKNIYKDFFKVNEGSSPLSVSCNLCEGKNVNYTCISWHMKHYHLPDETCKICHHQIPAIHYGKHARVCDGAAPAPELPTIVKSAHAMYSQFYTELSGNSFLPAKKARVACNLCAAKTVGDKKHYSRHFKFFHMPDQTCARCGEDIPARVLKNHMNMCNGESDRSKCQNKYKYCLELKVQRDDQEIDHKEEEEKGLENKEEKNKHPNNDVENPSTVDSEYDITLHEDSETLISSASEIEMYSETDSE